MIFSSEIGEENKKKYKNMESIVKEIFHLRGGSEYDTTVMYMWSHLFIFPRSSSSPSTNDEKLTVIVLDSQGLIIHKRLWH